MGKKGKLEKFAELNSFKNVYQSFEVNSPNLRRSDGEMVQLKGKWAEHFGNDNPITLELACGKGEYTIGLAKMYPKRNFIGMDAKGNRIWKGAKYALEEGKLPNVAFIRSQIDFIEQYFAAGEVQEIWITFADPQLGKPRKRLSSPLFLPRYKNILAADGQMHLKTDSPELYEYSLEMIEEQKLQLHEDHDDIYSLAEQKPEWEIKTYYEKMHLEKGLTIKYLRFSF
jgi:tRNA (guanine-N7-)-methyltransferase